MPATALEVLRPQIQCAQFVQTLRTQAGKFIQQLSQRLASAFAYLCQAVKRLKRAILAKLQNRSRARHPVSALAVNQMAEDFVGAPRVVTFIAEGPPFRQITQQG